MTSNDEEQAAHIKFIAEARAHVAQAHASIPGITADAHAEAQRIRDTATAEVDVLRAECTQLAVQRDALVAVIHTLKGQLT